MLRCDVPQSGVDTGQPVANSAVDAPSATAEFCGRFAENYPDMFAGADDTFGFLEQIEDHIHVEVRKLYPDAQLPSFIYAYPSENQLVMTYSSARPFAALADGLIQGAIKHYEVPGDPFSFVRAASDTTSERER